MSHLCLRSLFLSAFVLITLEGKHTYSYTLSDSTIDPLGILKRYDYLSTLRNNCAALCKGCNGVAKLENDICRCHIVSDYPMGCLQNIRRNAEILGVKLSPKYPVNRHKRCTGEAGLPPPLSGLSLGRILSNGLSGVNLDGQMVSAPSEALNTLSGIITAPLFEQIKAVFGGDSETADNTIPGQIVQNLPKALSSFTNILDTFNVALPRETVVGSPKDSDSSEMTLGDSFINDIIGSLPVINQVRAIFVGHPSSGGAETTLPVQLMRAVPKALTSAMDLFEPFNNVGLPRKMPASPRVDKSWLKDFDDDDDDDDDDKFNSGVQSQSQKIIVSPIKSRSGKPTVPESIPTSYNSNEISSNEDYSKESNYNSLGKTNTNNVFQNIGNILTSGDPQILQPQEAIIILT